MQRRWLRSCRPWIFSVLMLASWMLYAEDPHEAYSANWGPQIGTEFPEIAIQNHDAERQTLSDLVGPNGVALFFVRSADW